MSQARLEVVVIDNDKAIDTGIMVAVALALVSQIHNMDIKMVKIFFHS